MTITLHTLLLNPPIIQATIKTSTPTTIPIIPTTVEPNIKTNRGKKSMKINISTNINPTKQMEVTTNSMMNTLKEKTNTNNKTQTQNHTPNLNKNSISG